MKQVTFGFYILMIALLATATFVEKYNGAPFAGNYIYGSVWFAVVWALLTVAALCHIIRRKLYRRKGPFLLHLSFAVILAGACLTRFTGKQGFIHLRQGQPANAFVDADNRKETRLTFSITLDTFRIRYYPGTETPADYISEVHIGEDRNARETVSMNHILAYRGYRFYQSSFDEDNLGSLLSVNYDPWGIPVTYTGYFLLLLSMIGTMLDPGSGFGKLLAHPLLKRTGALVLLLGCSLSGKSGNVLSREEADRYRGKQVIYHDRVAPLNTLARDFVAKLTGKAQYKDYTPEQVLTGFLLYPDEWRNEPVIRIKNKQLQKLLGTGEYAAAIDLFDGNNNYRLQEYWNRLHSAEKQNGLLKAITETDEKVAIIAMLKEGTLIKPVPEGVPRLTSNAVRLELLYNRIPFVSILFKANLVLGLLTFIFLNIRMKHPKRSKQAEGLISGLLLLSFLFDTAGIGLRTYIGGRFPLSNGYETMLFTSWCILLVALLLRRRFPLIMPFGFLLSGFTLLVAGLGQMNPHITPLMPVLASPLLSLHVSCIMMSYSLLGFMLLNGLIAIFLRKEAERLALISRLLLYPAAFLLGIGIFIGAVWANVSWGRYWAWDPKEVWALITLMVYGLAFHVQSIKAFQRPLVLHLFLIAAFATVLMTWFGVNYFLGGIHSYANA
ncbi:MAG: cytochrome c biogenesis protein CcsA [Mediterranea sp.]|jgi:ABC-type transport system involved in cytochrome c biogenesis permease subunit|nr:cytochrome c biogenesis protein CcsA [Mediterranea sp.]